MGKLSAVSTAVTVVATVAIAGSSSAYAGHQSGAERLVGTHRTSPTLRTTTHLPQVTAPRATVGTPLGLHSFSDVQADAAHGHVFVTGGPGASGVVVTNLAGKKLKTLGSTPGASGMTLSANGRTLYVALADGDGIREIDTSTLTGHTVSTGANTCPQDVAVTAGTVWFSYTCNDGQGAVGSLDPATGTVTTGLATGFYYAPHLATSPGLSGALFTGIPSLSTLARYDVTGGATPSASFVTSREAGDNLQDLVVTPDGKDVIVASGYPYHHQVYRTSDLAGDGTYSTGAYPNSVAVNKDGLVAAGIDGISSKDIWLYRPGAAKPFKTVSFADGDYLQPRGLAFAGQSVYAVSGPFGGPFVMHVVSTKPNAPLKVTTNAHSYTYGAKAHVTAHLKVKGRVSIYATPLGGRTRLVHTGRLKHGAYRAKYAVTKRTLFTALYAGGAKFGQTVKSHGVKVHARVKTKAVGRYATSHGVALFHPGKDPHFVSTVSPNHAGGCVVMQAEARINGPWTALQGSGTCVGLDSRSHALGIVYGTHVAGEQVRVRAIWGGDVVNLKKTGRWCYARFTH